MKTDLISLTDDNLGILWWNSLSDSERVRWSKAAGNTGRAKDAWEAFKAAQKPNGEHDRC